MTTYSTESQVNTTYSTESQTSTTYGLEDTGLGYLLMEDGFYLLQENGYRIVLNISNPLLENQNTTTYTLETQ